MANPDPRITRKPFRSSRRNRKRELLVFAFLVVALLAAKLFLPEPEPLRPAGEARVIDGDSLEVAGQEIRLAGIDAPELGQSCERGGAEWQCGQEAKRQLRFFVRGARLSCEGREFDQYKRLLAVCRLAQREVNRWMVEEGWAVSYDDYPGPESKARDEKRGLWAGRFERPKAWRDRHPRR